MTRASAAVGVAGAEEWAGPAPGEGPARGPSSNSSSRNTHRAGPQQTPTGRRAAPDRGITCASREVRRLTIGRRASGRAVERVTLSTEVRAMADAQ